MTERRAHWGDDLIDAVRVRMTQCPYEDYNCEIDADAVYAVIAAVEDWQEARWGPECWVTTVEDANALFLHRAQTAEAQIQAVRETCDNFVALRTGNPQVDQVLRAQMLKDADEVRRILGGASWEARTGGNDD